LLSLRPALAVLSFLVAATGCGKPVREEECVRLLDRYVEKLVGSDRPELGPGDLVRLQAEARKQALTDPAFRNCTREVSRRQMDCALQAETVDRMEICLF
jgi:hypothetical protein